MNKIIIQKPNYEVVLKTEFFSMGKSRYFFLFQLSGWGLFFIITLLANLLLQGYHWTIVIVNMAVAISGFLITNLYRKIIHKYHWKLRRPKRLILPVFLASLILAVIWCTLFFSFHYVLHSFIERSHGISLEAVFSNGINTFLVLLIWSTIYFGVHFSRDYQKTKVEKLELEASVKNAQMERLILETSVKNFQLNVLKGQINPHFMFNSLNNIRALMLEDVDRSRDMLTYLSEMLRYSLNSERTKIVSVKQEIETVYNYFHLCSIQFENRLKYSVSVEPEIKDFEMPPMLIQLLVENGIKHGISQLDSGGVVNVNVIKHKNGIRIRVENSGHLTASEQKAEDRKRIGLKNITDRLKLMYGDEASFRIFQQNEIVVAEVIIPNSNTDESNNN